jgi:spore coat protein CotH
LYKASNFTGFEYLGDDPTLYAEKFEQKTGENEDDLAPLIRFLKFVSESSDEEFAEGLGEWLELNSFVKMMALDNLLKNNDSFVGMGSNYYLYYDKNKEQFTMLSWDMNLSMNQMAGGMGGGNNGNNFIPENFDPALMENFMKGRQMPENMAERELPEDWQNRNIPEGNFRPDENGNGGRMGGGENLLKERFFANEEFSKMYDLEYERLKDMIYTSGLAMDKTEQLAEVFISYNNSHSVIDQEEYNNGVDNIKNFIISQGAN